LFLFAEGNHLREPSHAKQYGDQMHTTVWCLVVSLPQNLVVSRTIYVFLFKCE
jgi:hypothetical protein